MRGPELYMHFHPEDEANEVYNVASRHMESNQADLRPVFKAIP